MIRKILTVTWNLVSGVFVLFFSLWMSGPGIAEDDTPTYRWYFMLLFVLWGIGVILQFKKRTRVIGIIITFIPTLFFLILLVMAASH
ncbi:hypothetical protein [Bacillus sinesaloumensis]|uniref:hypothetical protein n=1 Tax=Litchfieldia sinesaloumensis TaxID=1926280 RepID=UPI0009888513|nr:hypothetical protein [Bacillus sinesaloumensis]